MTHTITDRISEFAAESTWQGLPRTALDSASITTGNILALAVGGSQNPAVERTVRALEPWSPGAATAVLGRTEHLTPMWAALVHGMAAHVDDYDDTHLATVVHPGAPVVPAALAGAQLSGGNGRDVLAGVAVGTEVALRLGIALTPSAMDRGWHMTGVVGTVGAAIAAGRAMGLDRTRLAHAIGVAATQSGGLLEALGSMVKSLHPGKAASAGVEAAQLAQAGLDGPAAPLEGRRGLLALLRPGTGYAQSDEQTLLSGLGTTWESTANEIKPYACGVVGHPIIDLARELRSELAEGDPPAKVHLNVHPLVPAVLGRTEPSDGLEAKFSAVHCFAVGLMRDSGGPESFTDAAASDPAVADLRRRCTLTADPEVGRYAVHATVVTDDGRVIERSLDGARSLDADEVRDKARSLTGPVLGRASNSFVDTAFGLELVTGLDRLVTAGRPEPAGR